MLNTETGISNWQQVCITRLQKGYCWQTHVRLLQGLTLSVVVFSSSDHC